LGRRLLGFTSIPLLSSFTPLLLLPFVARLGGPTGWAAIGVGQALGGLGGVLVSYGWNVAGPARVARLTSPSQTRSLYSVSFWARFLMLVPVAVGTSGLALITSGSQFALLSALMALANTMSGMSLGWYGVGVGSSALILRYETLPKISFMLASLALMLSLRQVSWYPVGIILGTSVGLFAFHARLFGHWLPNWPGLRAIRDEFRLGFSNAAIDGTGALYTSAPVPLANSLGTISATASFSSADKIYRYGLFTIVALGNALQAWVLDAEASSRRKRQMLSVLLHAFLGLLGLGFFSFVGTLATQLLFGRSVAADQLTLVYYGFAFLAVSSSTPFIRNILIPMGKSRLVLGATISGAVIGLLAMFGFGHLVGPHGVALGFALSEGMTFLFVVAATVRLNRHCLGQER